MNRNTSTKQLEYYFGKSADPILVTNVEGKIQYVNHAWEKLTGYRLREIRGKNPQFLGSGKTPQTAYKLIWSALLKGKSIVTEDVIDKRKNGTEYRIRSTFYPLRENNANRFYVQVLHDITKKTKIENELKLHSILLNKMQEGVCLVSVSDGTIVYCNKKFERMLGYNKNELLNKDVSIVNYGSPTEASRMAQQIMQKLKRQGMASYTIQNRKKDGTPIWCKVHTVEFNHSHYGKVWVAVHADISKEKSYLDKIADSEKQLHDFVRDASDGIFIADYNGRYTYVNNMGCRMLGYSRRELTGKTIVDIIPREDVKRLWAERKYLTTGRTIVSEWLLVKKDGTHLPVEVSAKILSDGRWLGLVRDIREKRKLEHMRDRFISMISHELKSPITAINAFAQVIKKIASTNKVQKSKKTVYLAEQIVIQSKQLTRLVNDLLTLGKIQTAKLVINKQRFNIDVLIKEITDQLQFTTKTHHIFYKDRMPQMVYADKERISQVLTNLLTNAIKYSPESDKIIVRLDSNKNELLVSVQDFGPGIPREEQKRIFDSFYRVNEKSNEGGSTSMGLGLYISSEIIKKHKGKIWVESNAGKGTTFLFSLPLR